MTEKLIRDEYLNWDKLNPITWAAWEQMRANTYERNHLVQFMNDQCLAKYTRRHIENCDKPTREPTTYDDVTKHVLANEMSLRLLAGRESHSFNDPKSLRQELTEYAATLDDEALPSFVPQDPTPSKRENARKVVGAFIAFIERKNKS